MFFEWFDAVVVQTIYKQAVEIEFYFVFYVI